MFVTKIFQASMSRQNLSKAERVPFFLYVDEFQNFATNTFNEILSEARKYGLGLSVAHQFIKQIPPKLSDSLFGNVGTLMSFRISSEDAIYMKQHFSPFVSDYDIANLNIRELYCKTIIQGQVKDPFSLKTLYTPDADIKPEYISELYEISRAKYSRSLAQAKEAVSQQADVVETVESFGAPLI
jgi:type IV secretory pathway TraG/TraD family ATPase VirD4